METTDAQPDYYGILGVTRHASPEGIRRAYIRKAWQHHPDVHANGQDTVVAMREVNAAYETLSNPALRTHYDSRRTVVRASTVSTPRPRFSPGGLYASRSRRRHRRYRDPGVMDTVCLFLNRLARCVS